MPLAGTIHGQSDPFAPTQWSVILAAGRSQANPELARAALGQLGQTSWAPLYTFVRRRGFSSPDAQDLTPLFICRKKRKGL
jgi:RNA polymerase sigma-70 factor (ECF subfamily)